MRSSSMRSRVGPMDVKRPTAPRSFLVMRMASGSGPDGALSCRRTVEIILDVSVLGIDQHEPSLWIIGHVRRRGGGRMHPMEVAALHGRITQTLADLLEDGFRLLLTGPVLRRPRDVLLE